MKVDVLVCGGGAAGLSAAVAAGRSGAKTMLIERAPFSGGIVTCVGLPGMDGIADWSDGRILVRGVCLEMLVRLGLCAPTVERVEDIAGRIRLDRHGSVFIPCIDEYKIAADEILLGSGVTPLYHALVCGTETVAGRIAAVLVATKAGILRIEPRTVIDCTGDADVASFAGCAVDPGETRMPMTMHFRIGNVALQDHQSFVDEAADALAQARSDGALPMYYGPGLARAFAKDEVYVHAVRVPGDARDPFGMALAEIQGRKDAWTMWRYWKSRMQAFKDSYFIGSGPYIGVRETRRIIGDYVLTEQDVLAGRRFDDAVATGCWYMDLHPNQTTPRAASAPGDPHTPSASARAWGNAEGARQARESFESGVHAAPAEIGPPRPYDIPYRSLVARGVENLVVAGRCHSATRSAAGSTRVTATAAALGEAAGVAAGLSIASGVPVAGLRGTDVRARLEAIGAGAFTAAGERGAPQGNAIASRSA